MNASGKFEVKLQSLDTYAPSQHGVTLRRMSIDKVFYGELSATSQGEMLSATTPVQGSAGYVAIEHVTGTLADKSGSFVLQHLGAMQQGKSLLVLDIVPDSGTGELVGLTGKMQIRIEDGQHYYDFDYGFGVEA